VVDDRSKLPSLTDVLRGKIPPGDGAAVALGFGGGMLVDAFMTANGMSFIHGNGGGIGVAVVFGLKKTFDSLRNEGNLVRRTVNRIQNSTLHLGGFSNCWVNGSRKQTDPPEKVI
jgi:hypothetical protein